MWKKLFNLIFLMWFIHVAYAGDNMGKVVFFREYSYQGAAINYKILNGDSTIVRLRNNAYYEYHCLPGKYEFHVDKFKNSGTGIMVEPGKTYYIRFGIRAGMWKMIPELLQVDSISAYPKIYQTKLRKQEHFDTPFERPKSRLGLNFNSGFGFQDTQLITTTDGGKSSLSAGGGTAVGLKYGYELNRSFDLAVDVFYQYSELMPRLKNGSINFGRGVFSVTPSYIIPIQGGDGRRIKAGAGFDYYFGNRMNFKTSSIPGGINDNWIYKNALGFHANFIYEINFSEKVSFNYGLKYYNVSYSFESGYKTYPLGQDLITPNGTGLDLMLGIFYHF
jgi:hypothetical protein